MPDEKPNNRTKNSYLMLPTTIGEDRITDTFGIPKAPEWDAASALLQKQSAEPVDASNAFSLTRAIPLRFLPPFDVESDSKETIIVPSGALVTAEEFQRLQRRCGAWILTDEPEKICALLGLPEDSPAVKTEWAGL